MENEKEGLVVTQADRNAAAPYMGFSFRRALNGDCDEGTLVEAFARHRHQSTTSLEEERDALAKRVGELADALERIESTSFTKAGSAYEMVKIARSVLPPHNLAALNTDLSHAD